MVSEHLAGGGERSVVIGFELDRGHVVEVAVEAFGVVPVHPPECRELDVFDRAPGSLSGSADELGLVEPVDGLSERVVIRIAD